MRVNSDAQPDNSWITLEKAQGAFGWTEGQIRSKIARRWQRGCQWAIIDGRRMIDWREVDEWITREASGQVEESSNYGTPSTASGMRKRSKSRTLGLV